MLNGGDEPVRYPKRWRGYYRALKRGKPWAVRLSKMSAFSRLFAWHYNNVLIDLVPTSNKLMELMPKRSLTGDAYHMPVVLSEDHGLVFKPAPVNPYTTVIKPPLGMEYEAYTPGFGFPRDETPRPPGWLSWQALRKKVLALFSK